MAERIYLDAREMEHPVPLEKAIEAIRQLKEGNYFYMLHRKKPVPLLEMAQAQGMHLLTKEDAEGRWHILIARDGSLPLSELCDV